MPPRAINRFIEQVALTNTSQTPEATVTNPFKQTADATGNMGPRQPVSSWRICALISGGHRNSVGEFL